MKDSFLAILKKPALTELSYIMEYVRDVFAYSLRPTGRSAPLYANWQRRGLAFLWIKSLPHLQGGYVLVGFFERSRSGVRQGYHGGSRKIDLVEERLRVPTH